jgi:hypothetical protein
MLRRPHPRSCFFQKSKFHRLFGDNFLQDHGSLATQLLDLSVMAARAVSPASRFLPASRNSFDQL